MTEEPRPYVVKIETRTIFQTVLLLILLWVLFVLRDFVLVLLTSIVIASFIESVVQKLHKYKIPRTLAVLMVYVVSIAFLTILFYIFVPIFLTELSLLIQSLGSYIPQNSIFQTFEPGTLSTTRDFLSNVSSTVSAGDLIKNVQELIANTSGGFIQSVSTIFGGLFNVVLIGVITFYLSVQDHGIEYFLRVVSPIKHEEYVVGLWKRTERKIGLWLQGQMLLGALIGVILYLALTILGVKYSLVIALISAVMELIPFGIILAGLTAVAFAFTVGGIALAFKVLILYTIVQQFENYLIAPLIVNKVIGVSPLVVILSLLIGAQLAGLWGLLLGVPIAVCFLEYLSDVEKGKSVRYTSS